jgi:hypothetical protein
MPVALSRVERMNTVLNGAEPHAANDVEPVESGLVLVTPMAAYTFGDPVTAARWMRDEHPLLGTAPVLLCACPQGKTQVLRLLQAICDGSEA